jgi:hypothetical protein
MSKKNRRYIVRRVPQGILTIDRIMKAWSLTQGNRLIEYGQTNHGCEFAKYLPGRREG